MIGRCCKLRSLSFGRTLARDVAGISSPGKAEPRAWGKHVGPAAAEIGEIDALALHRAAAVLGDDACLAFRLGNDAASGFRRRQKGRSANLPDSLISGTASRHSR